MEEPDKKSGPTKYVCVWWVCLYTLYIYACVYIYTLQFSCSVMSNSSGPHGLQHARPPPSITNSWSSPKFMSIESVMPSNHLILCRPLLLLPSIFPSIRVFSNESALRIRWPKYWSFSFSISPSNEHSGLISFRMDWLDLLAVQGTLKSLLQHHSSKTSILSVLSFLCSPTLTSIQDYGKNHSLDQTDLCWQSNVSAFQYAAQVGHIHTIPVCLTLFCCTVR